MKLILEGKAKKIFQTDNKSILFNILKIVQRHLIIKKKEILKIKKL